MRAETYRRHALIVRVTHWLNAAFFLVMLMSGLQIFNSHPALYLGKASDFATPALSIGASADGARGQTAVFGHVFDTTGALGLFSSAGGKVARAFPSWATLPGWQSLADGRRWHFFFAWALVANGAIYWIWGIASRHLWRDIAPTRGELAAAPHVALEHLKLRFPRGREAMRYNVLQQLSYLAVIAVLFPLLILTGLTMSPRMDAEWPWLTLLFGGRQSARTLHFIVAFSLVGFALAHVAMVVLSGFGNNMRAMLTGRFAIPPAPTHAD